MLAWKFQNSRISKSTGRPRARPRKRAKVDQTFEKSDEESLDHQSGPDRPESHIQALVTERPGQFLIDREDDPTRGRSILLDRQHKKTFNSAATADSDLKKAKVTEGGSQTRVTRRRRRNESLGLFTGLVGPRERRLQQIRNQTFASTKAKRGLLPTTTGEFHSESELHGVNTLQRPTPNHPRVVIYIPRHSDFNPDQHIEFQSSLSSQYTSTSPTERPVSRFELSFPQLASAELAESASGIEIPDSQPNTSLVCGRPQLSGAQHCSRTSLSPRSRQYSVFSRESPTSIYSHETARCFINHNGTEPASLGLLSPSQTEIPDSFPPEEGLKVAPVLKTDSEIIRETQVYLCSQEIFRCPDPPDNFRQNQEKVPKAAVSTARTSHFVEEAIYVDIFACHSDIREVVNSQDSRSTIYSSHSTTVSILSQRDPNSQTKKDFQSVEAKQHTLFESIELAEVLSPNKVDFFDPSILYQLNTNFQGRTTQQHPVSNKTNMSEVSQPLPSSPSASRFPKAETPTLSLREKLKAMRKVSALVTAKEEIDIQQTQPAREIKSPSVIPQNIELPLTEEPSRLEVQHLDVPLPTGPSLAVRVSQPDTDSSMYTSQAAPNTQVPPLVGKTKLDPPYLGEVEFSVSLPMNSRVRDQYVSIIYQYRKAIEKLMTEDEPDNVLLEEIKTMINRVYGVTTHVDLDNGSTTTQEQESTEDEAVWAENCSAKFRFLGVFLDKSRQQHNHVAIIARGGQLLDILETFLKGKRVNYSRPDNLSTSDPKTTIGTLQVSLVASGEEGNTALPPPANLIIAFDDSFNAGDVQVSRLRHHMLNVGQLAPVVHLLVLFSAEHIVRCLAKETDPLEKLRNLVSCMTQTRHEVGQLFVEEPGPTATAEEVAAFLEAGGLGNQWTLPAIRPIEDIDLLDSASQDPDSSTQSEAAQVVEKRNIPPSLILKRPLDVEQDDTASKRQRVTPAAEVTHVSDSATQGTSTTQSTNVLNASLASAQSLLTSTCASHATREASLLSTLKDHTTTLSSLQFRYESRNNDYHALRREKNDLIAAAAAFERKRELQGSEINKLKAAITTLEGELREIRTSMMGSSIPEIAQLETLRQTNRDLIKENQSYASKLASLTTDFDFTRQQYQLASTSAASLASQVAALTATNKDLEQKASGQAAKLAAINAEREAETWIKRVEFLESVVKEREELLRKKEEEIRERRGRGMQTRGGSLAPKSPRADTNRCESVEKDAKISARGGGGSGLRFG